MLISCTVTGQLICADQLHSYRAADLRTCFCIHKKQGFFNVTAQIIVIDVNLESRGIVLYQPRSEKTGLRGFRPGQHKPGCIVTEDV